MNYYSYARSGLQFALSAFTAYKRSKILVPNYVCDALLQPFRYLEFDFIFYEINDDFTPNWAELERLVVEYNCWSVVMIHYFGQPQNIEKFQLFCKKNNLILIEDNAHGYGGKYKNKPLGTHGNIGITSPRKIVNTSTGGILYLNGERVDPSLFLSRTSIVPELIRSTVFINPKIYFYLLEFLNKKPNFDSSFTVMEPTIINVELADFFSSRKIRNFENCIKEISKIRRNNWNFYRNLLYNFNVLPAFNQIHSESCPWAYPFYVHSKAEKNAIISFLNNKKINVFPWPTLPFEQKNNESINSRWNYLLCIPIYNEAI